MRTTTHRRAPGLTALLVSVVLSAALAGCGGGDSDGGDQGKAADGSAQGGAAAPVDPAVPEECAGAFPGSLGDPDLGEVTLLPSDWPDPIADAVLCGTSSTADESQQQADFATSSAESEVLSTYEKALGGVDGYQVSREDPSGLGRSMLSGDAGGVYFEVEAVPGGYTLTFAR